VRMGCPLRNSLLGYSSSSAYSSERARVSATVAVREREGKGGVGAANDSDTKEC
jgi:hypothetical protein